MKKRPIVTFISAVLLILIAVIVLSFASCTVKKNNENEINDKQPIQNEIPENTGELENKDTLETEVVLLTLYFPDNDALYLHPEVREVETVKGEELASIVLDELFKGPVSENLSPCLDGEKLVNSVTVSDGLCTVDFNEDFAILNSGGSTRESFAIGAIVNSLCSLEGIDEVKININGNPDGVFGGHFTLEAPFAPQNDLIAK